MIRQTRVLNQTTTVYDLAYTYDPLGRKRTATIGGVSTRFYYDGQASELGAGGIEIGFGQRRGGGEPWTAFVSRLIRLSVWEVPVQPRLPLLAAGAGLDAQRSGTSASSISTLTTWPPTVDSNRAASASDSAAGFNPGRLPACPPEPVGAGRPACRDVRDAGRPASLSGAPITWSSQPAIYTASCLPA